MQLKLREEGNRSVWYNTVTGAFIVSSPSCSVQRDKYDGAMTLYNSWIDIDNLFVEEKESKNMSDEIVNESTIMEENKSVTIDEIAELIQKYTQQKIDMVKVDPETIIDDYLEKASMYSEVCDELTSKLDNLGILDDLKEDWEREALYCTEFCSIDALIEDYNELKETIDNVADKARDLVDNAEALKYEMRNYL